jgi:hypothetical protein
MKRHGDTQIPARPIRQRVFGSQSRNG